MSELERLRARCGIFMAMLLWAHVPVVAITAIAVDRTPWWPSCAAVLLAGAYQLTWWRHGTAPITRYMSAVALMGQPALLVYLLAGRDWQMDMHMYFFATLALTIVWCDWRVILLAAATIAVHHLMLDVLLPFAVFTRGADLARVYLHAGMVAFQTAVLIWLSTTLVASFERIGAMRDEIVRHNETLEQKVLERTREAQSANQAKSLFLANMSHEIRTPMNAILGFCHLALRTELTPKQHDYVSKARTASLSLLSLINDILDFSKIEAGKLLLEQAPFNLRHSLENTFNIAAVKAAEKGIVVRLDVDEEVPPNLVGDTLRFNQIVLNLVSNAIKFTDHGTVTVSIRPRKRLNSLVTLEVSVRDTGIGMTRDQQAKLFGSFSQADSSTTRRFGGSGLGLVICKQLIELMGGRITVDSEVHVGSIFTFAVVMGIGEAEAIQRQILPAELRCMRVLIVDDNSASREILQDIFVGWKMQVDLVASGKEAIAAHQAAASGTQPYDLVLMDWKMPGMDGIETVRAMRRIAQPTTLPAVLMVSAYAEGEARAEAAAAGISAFLIKPIAPATLLETITAMFDAPQLHTTPHAAQIHAIPMVSEALRGSRVLVAEDNEINREVAVEMLIDAGLIVDVAENGRIACERVLDSGQTYDAVLMDVQMPEMDGIAATMRIRQHRTPESLPIIAMTAHAYDTERQRCLAAGMNDHVAKPVDPVLLINALDRWLKPRTAVVAPIQLPPSPLTGQLPASLAPFDLAAALVRMNGKQSLLRKLIIDFGDNFATTAETMRNQITAGAPADARRLAHTLKGVSGALELRDVEEAARQIEDTLAGDQIGDVKQLLDQLERAMRPAVAASSSLKHAPIVANAAPAPERSVGSVIAELREQLLHRRLCAGSTFDLLEQTLATTPYAAGLRPVKESLARLDYGQALIMLDEIADKHSPSTEIVS